MIEYEYLTDGDGFKTQVRAVLLDLATRHIVQTGTWVPYVKGWLAMREGAMMLRDYEAQAQKETMTPPKGA